MTLSAAEQYLLELMNRARLDPAGEAARMGIDLNANLAAGTIKATAKQVLAPNALLEQAATAHSSWMIANDIFSHTGVGGSLPGARITAAGYHFGTWGENVGLTAGSGAIDVQTAIDQLNTSLFLSQEHRVNTLGEGFREVGLGAEVGIFTSGGTDYNAMLLTQDFGLSGTARFLTGVAYTDSNANNFYSIGEGRAGIRFTAQGITNTTADAGGYAIGLTSGAAVQVTGTSGTLNFSLTVDMTPGNVKLDLVNGTTFLTSGSVTLKTGINDVTLLGVGSFNATGNDLANRITGNVGNNVLTGMGGNDTISSGGGNDKLWGDLGNDLVTGGDGADEIHGGTGNDNLDGGVGIDKIYGDAGIDRLTGGTLNDTFIFANAFGTDTITDFSAAQNDVLRFDNAIWGNTTKTAAQVVAQFAQVTGGHVVFTFSPGEVLHLLNVTTLTALATHLEIF